jgi:hypothetical protein
MTDKAQLFFSNPSSLPLDKLINCCALPLPFIQLPPHFSSFLIDTVNMATTAMDYEAANGDRYEEGTLFRPPQLPSTADAFS